jgi:hypothetical protein
VPFVQNPALFAQKAPGFGRSAASGTSFRGLWNIHFPPRAVKNRVRRVLAKSFLHAGARERAEETPHLSPQQSQFQPLPFSGFHWDASVYCVFQTNRGGKTTTNLIISKPESSSYPEKFSSRLQR